MTAYGVIVLESSIDIIKHITKPQSWYTRPKSAPEAERLFLKDSVRVLVNFNVNKAFVNLLENYVFP